MVISRTLQNTLRSAYGIGRPSVVCLSVTFVRSTQPVELSGNILQHLIA